MGLGFPLPISHTVPVAVQMAEECSEAAKIAVVCWYPCDGELWVFTGWAIACPLSQPGRWRRPGRGGM